ncbi:midasin [Paragonimus westermani]|uniref:Midasin n=1 Tax=Paragonimus westermani TaxID=34504 RepID=A0A5J4NSY8_9TREM|nr:midasin [Paragonimus westermani]
MHGLCRNGSRSAEKESDHNARHLVVTTCQRLARLIALRAGLPRTPGPPDATPETVSAIIGELGGPANLARLVGLADDLLNQCTTAMGVCSRVDSMARDFSQRTDACRASLCGIVVTTNDVGKLEHDEVQAPTCIPFGSDKTVLHRIKASIHTVGQLAQDTVHMSSIFWKACSQQSLAYPSKHLTDLREVFGSEIWDSMVQTHLSTSVDAFDPLCIRMEQYLTQLDTVAADVRNSASSMLSSQAFLFTPCWVQWHCQFSTSVNTLLTVISEMMAECARSGFRFTALDQQLSCVSSRMRAELELLSCNLASARKTYTVELSPISSHGGDTQYEVLANNLIKSVLSTMETLYHADRQINVTEKDMSEKSQIELLNHYAQATCRACKLNLKHVSKYLSCLCSQLEQSDPSIFPVRLRLLRSLFPLIDALMQSVQLRSVQFWQLLDSWARLAECILRITGRLLTDGFCRPAGLDRSATGTDGCTPTDNQIGQTQEANGGGTSLTAEGVDTTGAKDVSNELECQEQIEGLMDDSGQDSEQNNQDEKRHEGESEGIEMPDDNFQGEFEDPDLMQDEKVDESLDETPGDELDDRMGGTGGQSDGLSKEMWASEDEDDRMDHTEDGNSSATQEKETGGVEEKDVDKNNCSTGDGSELQNRDKPKEINETENTTKKNADEIPSESQETSSDKRSKPKKSSQDTMTVAGDEGQADSPDDDLVSECKPDDDADDSPMKDDAILAELEAQRLEKENSDEPEDMPSDLPDQSMDDTNDNDDTTDIRGECASEDDVHTDGPPSDNQLDELMENEREGKDTVESFHYQPAAGDLTTKSEVPDELDCSRPQSDAWVEVMDTDENSKPHEATDQDSSGTTDHDLYQHITPEDMDKDGDEKSPELRVVDSATERQQEHRGQPLSPKPPDTDVGRESEDANGEVDAISIDVTDPTQPLNPLPPQKSCADPLSKGNAGSDSTTLPDAELDLITTLGAQRPPDSFICTRSEAVQQIASPRSVEQLLMDTSMPDNQYAITPVSSDKAREAVSEWLSCTQRSIDLARQLCESLRLVLEPTKAARMRGDYRTGKRINMRKIIPYLASQFRKDKIWLRRSQPSQREYRILIAVDDSSSMSDNLCRQMTFDALTTVVTALNLLEVGRVGICRLPSTRFPQLLIDNLVYACLPFSFGESVRVLHHLEDTWVPNAGPNVLARFTFQQSRTSLVQLLHSAIKMVMHACSGSTSTGTVPSQLLLILSDGVFSEDPQEPSVQAAVRLARDARLFPVCVILDDVRKKHSIFDLRRYTSAGKLTPYMDTFPLPFYVVLRDATALPNLLSDALRQWFELEASFGC